MRKQVAVSVSVLLLALGLVMVVGSWRDADFWSTPDRRGDRLMRQGRFAEAAAMYADPERRGVALFRAGDFKNAEAALAAASSAEGAYNRGNALVLLGKYDDAVKSYDRALTLRATWQEAVDNRAVAVVRRDRLKTHGGDATGGQVKADDVVFDKQANPEAKQTTEIAGGEPLSDEQLRGLWLRRVRTKPADFLRAKFAFQTESQKDGRP